MWVFAFIGVGEQTVANDAEWKICGLHGEVWQAAMTSEHLASWRQDVYSVNVVKRNY